ncbi:Sm-like ribonucleoprotein [Filobasidium floriforme]|uniref:Sm-like ribonucleoprotein n=1 Tax=Filobasidium floriforme TaxID=5210 RepID=UPI001E8EC013|nr:Sm-like ribonucleoprotein [Filobasidium floriforme]KAH8084745.1 Sm-like ribonucleoprotein [Filobasidium floriforme]
MDALIPFTTSGSLVDIVDKRVLIVLRDGRNLFGVLRSYDQYANLVLESTIERIFHTHKPIYTDAYVGLFLIRGENVVLLGEVDLDMEDEVPVRPAANAEEAKEIMASIEEKKAYKKRTEPVKTDALTKMGFSAIKEEGDNY